MALLLLLQNDRQQVQLSSAPTLCADTTTVHVCMCLCANLTSKILGRSIFRATLRNDL